MLTQEECKELVLRSPFQRRRPTAEFVASRVAARARRLHESRKLEPGDWLGLWNEYLSMAGGASSFNLVLDTTAPGGGSASINGGASSTSSQSVTVTVSTTDSPTTGYQILVYGDVDESDNANIQTDEGDSTWITPTWTTGSTDQAVKLTSGDGTKTIHVKIRDDVWNTTSALTDTIALDTTVPVITITSGPDVTKISKVSGKRVVTFAWQPDVDIQAFKIKVVANSGAAHSTGTTILVTNGSTNMTGTALDADESVTSTIDGRDLEVASAGDGTKVVKIFGQDATSGLWSTA